MRICGICLLPIVASLACGSSDTSSTQEDGSSNASLDAGIDAAGSVVLAGCDPFAARPLPITLGTIVAAGQSAAGVIYAVDQVDSSQRVFVSDANGALVRQRVAGSGFRSTFRLAAPCAWACSMGR